MKRIDANIAARKVQKHIVELVQIQLSSDVTMEDVAAKNFIEDVWPELSARDKAQIFEAFVGYEKFVGRR